MKHTIAGMQQTELLRLGLNHTDAEILGCAHDFFSSGKTFIKVEDNKVWFWLLYEKIIEDLPAIGIKSPKSIAAIFRKFIKAGVIEKKLVQGKDEYMQHGKKYTRYGTFTYFCFTPEMAPLKYETSAEKTAPNKNVVPEKAQRGCSKKRTPTAPKSALKDPLVIDDPVIDYNVSARTAREIIHEDGEWVFYSDQTATYNNEPTRYYWDSLPRSLPFEVMAWRDARILEAQTTTQKCRK